MYPRSVICQRPPRGSKSSCHNWTGDEGWSGKSWSQRRDIAKPGLAEEEAQVCPRAEVPALAACSTAPGAWGEHKPRGRGAAPSVPTCAGPCAHPAPRAAGRWGQCAWQSRATPRPGPARQARGEAADGSHMRSCRFVTDLLHGWLLSVPCSTFPTPWMPSEPGNGDRSLIPARHCCSMGAAEQPERGRGWAGYEFGDPSENQLRQNVPCP